ERTGFTDTPVRVTLNDVPTDADSFAVFQTDGTPLPFEVETWDREGSAVVWVKLPEVPAHSATVIWAYFGGGGPNDPTKVWDGGHSPFEHLSEETAAGRPRSYSPGKQRGTVIGAALSTSATDQGTVATDFGSSRIEYRGDVGGGYDRFTV